MCPRQTCFRIAGGSVRAKRDFGCYNVRMTHRGMMIGVAVVVLTVVGSALAQKDTDEGPTAVISFIVLKDDSGKPVRNAAVIMHEVNAQGKQGRGDLELKTDPEGKTNFDDLPYGTVRVQVLAHGFQTYGEDFVINKPKVELTIKLKRPQGQYSVYEEHPNESNAPPKDAPPPASDAKKPN